ncbi:hypothetical protein COT69_01670 [candidate division WWE3 bacterium CG09_land_8_20_14_0_10_39_24]|uniref:Homing endonuclease LAGLIDADG domain-containing protein n=2 Tax=Katanobacteria TaxID=422282 RepID=A0A2G9XCT2_UNCKA|nr:MAG: hypothetical protein AUJ94_01565 [bacterium CG2_30_40_12]OJI08982.1 MAG: hypothetical protein BK003_01655 [bacterium CG09_39_24]PIP04785.1 MAG: hypothetical protein COX53_00660 [candidate division WWE3 bacterium CG23_combo_of_CG06-09_8_20_14_all_40_14]PIS12888.1 MAG: hypothetical protein COT69_01670 [candidate division WWE3 bacterium CG09_land_8_20_14_0_10_39_24]
MSIKITPKQEGVVIGSILGDGYVQKTGSKNARLRYEHSSKQKLYLVWKVSVLGTLFNGKPVFVERVHPKTNKTYKYVRHQSNSTPYLGKLRKIFYPEGRKIIPSNLQDLLKHPISLAVWFFDDGYLCKKHQGSYLYLGKVSSEEATVAQIAIHHNFDIDSKVYSKGVKGYALYFNSANTKKLVGLIKEFASSDMIYKVSLTP